MLTIGEFSRICFVTKKTLRHYDEIGLLRPEYTAENGYRYYTVGQLRTMLLINRLKSYGFSLPEISAVLASPSDALLAEKLAEKRRALKAEMQNTRHVLRQLDEDVDKLKRSIDIMEQNIVIKKAELAPMTVYGVRKAINVKDFQELFGQLYMEIEQNKLQPLGPPMAFYHDEDFSTDHSDIEVGVPVADGTPGTHVVPGGEACFATLVGPYEPAAFTAVYAALMKWTEDNGYRIASSPYDKYVRGGADCPPEEYVTEIYFPITK
ncbi:MerR family transcriptional regulator [Ruminococcaceae bacterium OttesenSCG-928-D13]|nr:MerR family transcriptional regulator [Ruminococcaceae bacterium OttesenSCG-928-D13]